MKKQKYQILERRQPLVINRALAQVVGLNRSIVLQQVSFWLEKGLNIIDDVPWTYNTLDQWLEQFPFWSKRTLQNIFRSLEEDGLLIARKNMSDDPRDRTKWISINYEKLDEIVDEHVANLATCNRQDFLSQMAKNVLSSYSTKITSKTTRTQDKKKAYSSVQEQAEIDQEPTSGGENFDEPFAQPNERAGGGHEDFLSPEYFEGRHRELHGESWRFTSKDRRDLGELKSKYTPDEIRQKMDLLDRAIRLGYQCQDVYLARRKFSPGTLLHESITPRMLEMVQKKVRSKIDGQYEHTSEEEMIRQFNED